MRENIIPKDIHPEIAKILGEFVEDICPFEAEKPTPPTPTSLPEKPIHTPRDIDERLMHYSPEYIEYKPGVVEKS